MRHSLSATIIILLSPSSCAHVFDASSCARRIASLAANSRLGNSIYTVLIEDCHLTAFDVEEIATVSIDGLLTEACWGRFVLNASGAISLAL